MAVLSVAIAIVTAELIVYYVHAEPFASSLLCAIMFSAWFGGLGPGLIATALAILALFGILIPSFNSFAIDFHSYHLEIKELPRIVLFAITGLFVTLLSAAQRRASESLRRSRDDLIAGIEEQRRIEGALQKSQTYLAEAQRLSGTGSFGWSVATGEILWSDETFRIFERDRAAKPTLEFIIERTHPEDRASVQKVIGAAQRDGKDFDHEYRLLMPDAAVKSVHVVAHAVKDASGGIEYVGAVRDVTASKRAEEKLSRAQNELTHVTRLTALGELTASVAHEVSQPLAAILINAETCLRWLDREPPKLDEARGSVKWIIGDTKRASEVIQRVRSLAKRTDIEKVPLHLNEVVNEVVVLVQSELRRNRVSLRIELAPALPVVLADRVQLQQVIINLLINGIEAMHGVTDRPRELVIRSDRDGANLVFVAVKDSGVGISAENANRLFDAFFTTKSSGLGMGLSICRSIIEAHGGQLWASSNPGPGATFQFTLPVHRQAVA
jgi:C4-dicarboxylate-specific signal transduction histidine kinase